MLKYRADIRSVAYMILALILLILLWNKGPEMSNWMFLPLYILQLLIAVTISVITHNHKHLPMWQSKLLNHITDNWLTVFYGFPVFAWVPTHMHNHHQHVNTQEDYTRTYRFTEKSNLLTLITYPTISGYYQQPAVKAYFWKTWKTNKEKGVFLLIQLISLATFTLAAFLIDWQKALTYVVVPQQVSLFAVLIFNYVQHVHTDEESEFNNSRNFVGGLMNFVLLNNGYHTVHHMWAGVHWSLASEKHKEIEHLIHPSLNEHDFGWYLLKNYVLGIFIPKFRSKSMRVARMKGSPVPAGPYE